MNLTEYADWQHVNRQMIAKILAELEYERTLRAEAEQDGWRITLGDAVYRFRARRGIWGWLHIDADSLSCGDQPLAADQTLRQLAQVLSMNDAQIAEHLEDLYATLRGDLQLRRRATA
ncbi:Aerobactin synthase IucC [Serratia rubidaea]|uniref:Aerobactin synthase IucC n=1 Tax=Serratia rubidaea TaxID=61652 RepID=A0A3S4FT43_SERRU|nr:Aerobactin synthase IucC [Serratia rubidaea]